MIASNVKWLLICLLVISLLLCSIRDASTCINSKLKETKHKYWSNFEDVLELRKFGLEGKLSVQPVGFHRDLMKMVMFPTAVSNSDNISQQCVDDSLFYVESLLLKGNSWAIKMAETTGRLPASIVGAENYHAQGLFDECQAIRSDPFRFRGKYCSVFFKLAPLNQNEIDDAELINKGRKGNVSPTLLVLRQLFGSPLKENRKMQPKVSPADARVMLMNYPSLDVCLPSSCSATDLGESIAHLIGSYVVANNQSIVTIADENFCSTDDRVLPQLDGPAIALISLIVLVGILVGLATVHETWHTYNGVNFIPQTDSMIVSVLHCFSALRNCRKLFSMEKMISSSENFSCLHGIRFLAAFWIIFGHIGLKFSSIGGNVFVNPNAPQQLLQDDLLFRPITNSTVAVDTFFLMSGLLMSFYFLQHLDRNSGEFNVGAMLFLRYLRLTPVYAVVLAATATLAVYLGNGPNWYIVTSSSEACRNNWWQHLLYINNFFPMDANKPCMVDSWYLAVEMQLFLIAPFVIYVLWRWQRAGLVTLSILTLGSAAATFLILAIHNLPPTLLVSIRSDEALDSFIRFLDHANSKPWTRASPYFIGILIGWYLYRSKYSVLKLSSWFVTLLWTISIGVLFSVTYSFPPQLYGNEIPRSERIFQLLYGSLHRVVWSLALAWVIVACIRGYGGLINHLFSWRGFMPLSRLTYCFYLMQFNYISLFFALNRKLLYFSGIGIFTTAVGLVATIFGLSFVMSILFEGPFLNLLKLISEPKSTPSYRKKDE